MEKICAAFIELLDSLAAEVAAKRKLLSGLEDRESAAITREEIRLLEAEIKEVTAARDMTLKSDRARLEAGEKFAKWRASVPPLRAAIAERDRLAAEGLAARVDFDVARNAVQIALAKWQKHQNNAPTVANYALECEIVEHSERGAELEGMYREALNKQRLAAERRDSLQRDWFEAEKNVGALANQERWLRPAGLAPPRYEGVQLSAVN